MTRGSEPGYRRQPKLYRLVFDQYPGLVVRTRTSSVEMFLDVTALQGQKMTVEIAEDLFRKFSDVLVSWNLEYDHDGPINEETGEPFYREGDPVPTTFKGLIGEDWDFVNDVINAWMTAVVGVSAPLETPSKDGALSLVESIPMEISSPNLAS